MMLGILHDIKHWCSARIYGRIGCLIYITVWSSLSLSAQTDSTAVADSEDNIEYRTISYAPESVWEQKRYTPRENDTLFFNSPIWRRFYVGVGGGIQGLSDNIGSVSNASFNAFVGYKFTPIHSLRLHGSMINYTYATNKPAAKSIGMGIDYVANLTNFALGYNPARMFDVSSVVGLGVRYNSKVLGSRIAPYAHIGLSANLHLNSNFSLFLEPYVGLQRSNEVLFGRENPEKWNLMYGFSGGLQLALNSRKDNYAEADSIYRKFFFDSSIGVALPLGVSEMMHSSGTSYQMALGMWLNPMLGLRIGAHGQSSYWSTGMTTVNGVPVRSSKPQAIMGGRAELMLNPLNFSKKWRDQKDGHDFALNVLMGADFGWNMKSGMANTTSGPFRCYYYGMTGALQFQYRIAKPGTYIYIEPRYLASMYHVPYQNTHNSLLTVENSMSVNVGTRIYMTHPTLTGSGNDEFTPHWWAGVDVGGVKWQRVSMMTTGGLGINPSVGFSLGYDWKPLLSLRGQVAYQRMYNTHTSGYAGYAEGALKSGYGLWDSSYDALDVRLSYMLNLNNLLQGYDAERRFNLWLTAGPTLSYIFGENNKWVDGQKQSAPKLSLLKLNDSREGKASPGMSASLMAALRVAKNLEVTAEAMGQYNFLLGVAPETSSRLNNIKYGFALGTRYHFMPGVGQLKAYRGLDENRFFFDSNVAWATSAKTNPFRLGGSQYAASLGMWFNPVVGARLGINVQTMQNSTGTVDILGAKMRRSYAMALGGARAELMLNPLNFISSWRNREGGNDFEVNMLVGADLGGITKSGGSFKGDRLRMYYGWTSAMQFLYRINSPGTYIFVEPRVMSAKYNSLYGNTGVQTKTNDYLFSLGVGTRVYLTNPSFNPTNSNDFVSHWWAGLDFGGVKTQHKSTLHKQGGIGFNPAVSMSWGYDWKPLASFRAQLAYQRLTEHMVSSYSGFNAKGNKTTGTGLWENGYNVMDLRLGYMLNINNFLQGYNADRKFNLWLIAGPTLSWIMSEDNKWNEDQKTAMLPVTDLKLSKSYAGHVSPALTGSMMASLNVAKNVDVTAEVLGQYNFIRNTNPGDHSLINNIKYGVSVGARYHFGQDALKNLFSDFSSKPWHKGLFVDAAYGWAIPTDGGLGMHGSGSSMQISMGYWFNSLIGAKIGVVGQQTYWDKTQVAAVKEPVSGTQVHAPYSVYKTQLMLGGRAELMLNPLNLISSRRNAEDAPRWDMNMSLGMNFGGMVKVQGLTRGYVGFTSALTALYRLSKTTQIYLEPRYDVFNYTAYNDAFKYDQSFSDKVFTISVGTRITRPVGESKDSMRPKDKEKMAHRGFWAGASLGGSKMIQTLRNGNGGVGIQPSMGLTAGYDFDRLNTVRAHISYDIHGRYRTNQPYSVVTPMGMQMRYKGAMNSSYHQLDLRLLYMLNVTNMWTGYDKRNVFNMYFEIGPSFSSIVSESNTLAEGEYQGGQDFKYIGKQYAGNKSMGLAMGIMMALKLTPKWDLTSELMGQFHFNRQYMPENYARFVNAIKMNFSVGTRYNF